MTLIESSGNGLIDGLTAPNGYALDENGFITIPYSIAGDGAAFSFNFTLEDGVPELTQSAIAPSAAAISLFETGLDFISRITNITFTEVIEQGNTIGLLRLSGNSAAVSAAGLAFVPGDGFEAGNIFLFEHRISPEFLPRVVLHELGHTLGLSHTSGEFPIEFWGAEFTVMAPGLQSALYPEAFSTDLSPTGFGYADILALQHIYGVSETAFTENNVYSFDLNERYFETIYDLGGTDTIKITGTGKNVEIDLTLNPDYFDGSFINVGTSINLLAHPEVAGDNTIFITHTDTVFVSPETIIENVRTADGDTLHGDEGNDTLTGGAGADVFVFEANNGSDIITDFALSEDVLDLSGTTTDFTDLASIQAAATEIPLAAGTTLLLINTVDGTILLENMSLTDLTQVTFVF